MREPISEIVRPSHSLRKSAFAHRPARLRFPMSRPPFLGPAEEVSKLSSPLPGSQGEGERNGVGRVLSSPLLVLIRVIPMRELMEELQAQAGRDQGVEDIAETVAPVIRDA